MQYIIKFFFSFIFLCGISLISNSAVLKADSLYASGNYFEASIEFERQIFQGNAENDINRLRYKKALCYRNMKDFGRALNALQPTYFSNPNDSLYRFVCYEQALCYYLNNEPARALWKIDEYLHRSSDSTNFSVFLPIKILSLHETYKWNEAKQSFIEFIELQQFGLEKETALKLLAAELYSKKNRPRIKSLKAAKTWSRFIPGSGQIYAGKSGEGITNFLINASVLTFAGFQVYNGFYITGYLVGLGFFNKTYHGGMKRAEVIASQKNKQHMVEFNREVNQEIISIIDSK
ncbi:hypothetical protein [uncultured Draconibacterium sp.]|uniref:hypothetical protein n=1 Tax=uncultured Draconibacterium sp. TaxID=1573823 RepID=UPI0029C89A80|nr:hypothetical protein [uncultured Draconibacterium sp.]